MQGNGNDVFFSWGMVWPHVTDGSMLMHVDAEAKEDYRVLIMIGGLFMGVTPLLTFSGD